MTLGALAVAAGRARLGVGVRRRNHDHRVDRPRRARTRGSTRTTGSASGAGPRLPGPNDYVCVATRRPNITIAYDANTTTGDQEHRDARGPRHLGRHIEPDRRDGAVRAPGPHDERRHARWRCRPHGDLVARLPVRASRRQRHAHRRTVRVDDDRERGGARADARPDEPGRPALDGRQHPVRAGHRAPERRPVRREPRRRRRPAVHAGRDAADAREHRHPDETGRGPEPPGSRCRSTTRATSTSTPGP